MQIHQYNTPTETLEALAAFFIARANQAILENGRFTVALSGGSSPKKLYELLASDAYRHLTDWTKVYFFFGDERNVPATHPDSNFLMATKALLDPLSILPGHIYPINTSLAPEAAAADYQQQLTDFFPSPTPAFDLVLLGLGDNSHTASLFPHTPVLQDELPGVRAVFLEEQQVWRITLNAPLINQAHQIAFLVYGEGKAEAVHHIIAGERNIAEYPAQLIATGQLHWFLDAGAAKMLDPARQ